MNQKTDYPDLERSPNVSFWKHLLIWFWNKPRWISEKFYEKYFLATKRELQEKKIELIMLKYKVEQLHGVITKNYQITRRIKVISKLDLPPGLSIAPQD